MSRTIKTKEKILRAAKECFDLYGEKGVSMEDISERAKVHRHSIYRLFKNRHNLLREVVFRGVEESTTAVIEAIAPCQTLEEAVVAGTAASVFDRKDKTLVEHFIADPRLAQQRVPEYLEIDKYFAKIWKGVFLQAKRNGEIDPTWTYPQFSLWLRGVQYVLLAHQELSVQKRKELLKTFIRPGFKPKPMH